MKKLYEKRIMEQTRRLQTAEQVIRKKNEYIKELGNYIKGQEELLNILSGFLCEGIYKSGKIEIDRTKLNEKVEIGYNLNIEGDKIIIESKGEGEGIEIEL